MRWGIPWDKDGGDTRFIWKLFMQDDQKDSLPICANTTFKVPLWLNTAASPGFSHKLIKLEKTISKNAENKLKSLGLECACVPRPGTSLTVYGD